MHIPRKRFGQHFLRDKTYVDRIVAALAPHLDQHLVEIGPGQGALTIPVLKQIHQLDAIELDRDLIPDLEQRTQPFGQLKVYQGDVLDFDFATLRTDDRLLRVFGNLPYNISSPLIFHLLDYAPIISDMLFMLQKEMADRLSADADSEHYGRLSVMVQYHCDVKSLFDVPATAFSPPPQVESSIVSLVPYKKLPFVANDYDLFSSIVKCAFSQRRKTLRNSLKNIIDDDLWPKLLIESDLRAENLHVSDFVSLSNAISRK